ncbi:MAG: YraN family protein [Methylocystaceae bacterium]
MNKRQQLGQLGEEIAVRHLKNLGYNILQQRYRTAQGEIDIIANYQGTLIFIEVKARTSTRYGLPSEAVTYHKQTKIRQTALAYLQAEKPRYNDLRFDVISLLFDTSGQHQLEHIKNAF